MGPPHQTQSPARPYLPYTTLDYTTLESGGMPRTACTTNTPQAHSTHLTLLSEKPRGGNWGGGGGHHNACAEVPAMLKPVFGTQWPSPASADQSRQKQTAFRVPSGRRRTCDPALADHRGRTRGKHASTHWPPIRSALRLLQSKEHSKAPPVPAHPPLTLAQERSVSQKSITLCH